MLQKELYKSWFLPTLRKSQVWEDLISALTGELVMLQMYNMGTGDKDGFTGTSEDISLSNIQGWLKCKSFDKTNGEGIGDASNLSIANDTLTVTFSVTDGKAVYKYPFLLGRKYRIEFDLVAVAPNITLGIGYENTVSVTGTGHKSYDIIAGDYFMYFWTVGNGWTITNLTVTGIVDSFDSLNRKTVLSKLINIENASYVILERMRDSLGLPVVHNLDKTLLKEMVYGAKELKENNGSEIAGAVLLYMLGYAVNIKYLYARKGDYEAKDYSYLQQKKSDTLVSTSEKIYGVVVGTSTGTYTLTLQTGHNIVRDDKIFNQTNNFYQGLVRVLEVNGDVITLESAVACVDGDWLDVYRVYRYPVNPNPTSYFKTAHIDVEFANAFENGSNLTFTELQVMLEKYLPLNVCIRFFGYKLPETDELFELREINFTAGVKDLQTLVITDFPTMPEPEEVVLVFGTENDTVFDLISNGNHAVTINGVDKDDIPVDVYSYVGYLDEETGEPVYLTIPID